MAKLAESEVRERLQKLPSWALTDECIHRQFRFGGFAEAVAFVVRLGFEAEAADHHPDILINYSRVTLSYSTHSERGLTDKDFAGAAKATEIAEALGAR